MKLSETDFLTMAPEDGKDGQDGQPGQPGQPGKDGVSITSANVYYTLSPQGPDGTPPDDADFTSDNFPTTLKQGDYVWQATKVELSEGAPIVTGKQCLGATTDFLQGVEVYAVSQSGTQTPAKTDWSTSYVRRNGYYLWTATKVTYTNGDEDYLNPKCVGYWGTNGQPGTQRQRIYRSLNSDTYTGDLPSEAADVDNPPGWSFAPTAISEAVRYRYVSERTSNDGGTTWSNWSSPVIDGYMAEDGTSIAIKGEAKGVVAWGESVPATGTAGDIWLLNNNSSDGDDYEIFLSGSESESLSANMGDGFLISGSGHLWQKVRETATSATLVRWKDVGQIQGPQGPPGDDAVTYTITLAGSAFVHNPNTGMLHVNIKGRAYKTVGGTTTNYYQMENQAQLSLYFLRQDGTEDELNRGDYIVNNDTFSTQYYDGCGYDGEEVFVAVMIIDGREVARASIQIETDGLNGESIKGDTGRMYYIAGKWDAAKTYTRTAALCPVVYIATGTGVSAEWWYLDADTAQGDSQKPGDSSTLWKPVAGFGVVLTEAIFVKEFAQFGACIIARDWMISYYGKLYSDGTEVMVVDSGDVEHPMLYPEEITPNSPAYHYFNAEYPDKPGKGIINFVPQYAVDLKTGEAYMQKAHIKGDSTFSGKIENGDGKGNKTILSPEGVLSMVGPEYVYSDGTALKDAITKELYKMSVNHSAEPEAVVYRRDVQMVIGQSDWRHIRIHSNEGLGKSASIEMRHPTYESSPDSEYHSVKVSSFGIEIWEVYADDDDSKDIPKLSINADGMRYKEGDDDYYMPWLPKVYNNMDSASVDNRAREAFVTECSSVILPGAASAKGMKVYVKGGRNGAPTTVSSRSVIWKSNDATAWEYNSTYNMYTGNIQGYSHIFVSDGMRWIDFHCSMGQL